MAEVISVDALSESRAIQRPKFGEEHESALLKEVIAFGAHVCKRGSQMENFDAIAAALNKGGVCGTLNSRTSERKERRVRL
jgi:hypothetical protein